jgi:hypothetical protein
MTEEEWDEICDLVAKMESGKYKCGMAAQSAFLAAHREIVALRRVMEAAKVFAVHANHMAMPQIRVSLRCLINTLNAANGEVERRNG